MKRKSYLLLTLIFTFILGLTSIPSLSLANEDAGWEKESNLLEARAGAASAEVNGIIYIFGGTAGGDQAANGEKKNTTFAYDTKSDTWTRKKDMPTARSAVSAVSVGTKIYVIGGYYGSNSTRTDKVEVYDTLTDTWEAAANLLETRSWVASVLLDNNIYVIGGGNNNDTIVPAVEKYDIQLNKWTKLNNFPIALNSMSAFNINNKIYALGGHNRLGGGFSEMIYEYDIERDNWIQKGELTTAITATASAVVNNEIYLMGGITEGANGVSGTTSIVQIYNPETNQTRIHSHLTFERGQSSGIFTNGKLYIIGGISKGKIIDTVESYTLVNTTDPITPVDPTPVDPNPEPKPSGDRAILTVTMITGLDKEFDLSMSEVNDFINWYDAKENGSGPARYGINKHNNNKGPFTKRVDYVVFKNILSFKVDEYDN